MGSLSIWHWLIVAIVIMLLFGKGRISEMMGDLAKGIKSFKHGLAEDDEPAAKSEHNLIAGERRDAAAPPAAAPHVPSEPTQIKPVSSGDRNDR